MYIYTRTKSYNSQHKGPLLSLCLPCRLRILLAPSECHGGTVEISRLLNAIGRRFHRFLHWHVLAVCCFLAANHCWHLGFSCDDLFTLFLLPLPPLLLQKKHFIFVSSKPSTLTHIISRAKLEFPSSVTDPSCRLIGSSNQTDRYLQFWTHLSGGKGVLFIICHYDHRSE